MKILIFLTNLLFISIVHSSAFDFENLYKQMNNDLNEVSKEKAKKEDDIRAYCNSLKRLPFTWKEDFAKNNKINVNSIKFAGAIMNKGLFGSYCTVKSSSDIGVCRHSVVFINKVPRILNECR